MRSVDQLTDFHLSLKDLKGIIDDLIEQYGEGTIIYTDAGHNNVEIFLDV
jgi:hypothetical protein